MKVNKYKPLTQPLLGLREQHILMCQRYDRFAKAGVDPVETKKKIQTIQRKQARALREHGSY